MAQTFAKTELERRQAGARRMAWLIGAAVVAIYIIGFFVKRG